MDLKRHFAGAARAVKHGLAVLVAGSGGLHLLRSGQRVRGPRVHVFGYHRVVPDAARYAGRTIGPLCVSTATFAAHLDHLMRRYHVWSFDDALDLLTGQRKAPDRDVAVLTFDDGYADVLEHAAPLLTARRLPATVYITTGPIVGRSPLPHDRIYALVLRARAARVRLLGSPVPDRLTWPLARADFALQDGDAMGAADALLGALPMTDLALCADALAARVGEPGPDELAQLLDWDGVVRLHEMGIDIGAHGASHTHLPLEDDERLIEELAAPRADIARRLGAPPTTLSYPAGRYDQRVVEAARAAGYRAAVTTEDRRNRVGADPYRVGRKVMCEDHGLGLGGRAVGALTAAQLDGLFSTLGLARAVPGDRGLDTPWR